MTCRSIAAECSLRDRGGSDAIHLASAIAVSSEIDAFVTYDDRLAEAARAVGLPVVRPA